MDSQKVLQAVGQMIVRNSKSFGDDRAARQAFDRYVFDVAEGRAAQDLSEGQIRTLQACDRRTGDRLPKAVSDALGLAEGNTYREAMNLCEKSTLRAKEDRLKPVTERPKAADRRQSDRRRKGIADLVRSLRKRLKRAKA